MAVEVNLVPVEGPQFAGPHGGVPQDDQDLAVFQSDAVALQWLKDRAYANGPAAAKE